MVRHRGNRFAKHVAEKWPEIAAAMRLAPRTAAASPNSFSCEGYGLMQTRFGKRSEPEMASCRHLNGGEESRWWDLNPQPPLYESGALPLSYIGDGFRIRAGRVQY